MKVVATTQIGSIVNHELGHPFSACGKCKGDVQTHEIARVDIVG